MRNFITMCAVALLAMVSVAVIPTVSQAETCRTTYSGTWCWD